ncbi:MAG: hypothetical protein RTV41_10805 [Candidatus Thorarchaeota archaeon]
MKHSLRRTAIIILVSLLLQVTGIVTGHAQNDTIWQIQDHEYTYPDAFPRDISFRNVTHGWATSQNSSGLRDGIILHTVDAGESWQLQLANESQLYRSIEIHDEDTLWVTSIGGLVFSQNGGLTWNMTHLGESDDPFYGIHFINQTHGWTGSNPYLYKTSDAGLSWQRVDSWTYSDWARKIHFVTESEGWAIGFFGIYHTSDNGDTWEKTFDYGGWSFSFIDDNEAWAVSDNMVAHMVDGESWSPVATPRASLVTMMGPYFSDIQFLDTNNGWLVGRESEVAYTPNGGRDWYSQSFPRDTRVMAIDFINITHGWAIGWDGYIYRTTQGNSLGSRLWTGFSDYLFLTIVGGSATMVVVIIGAVVILRKRRRISTEQSKTTTIAGAIIK